MYKFLLQALICLSTLIPLRIHAAQLQSPGKAATPSLSMAITLSECIQEIAEKCLAETRELRKSTTREAVEAAGDLIAQRAKAISTQCRLLDEALAASSDDPRIDLIEIRANNTQIDANARFAAMALRDLLHALDMQDLELRSRALQEMEGGFRFIRMAAAETTIQLHELDRLSP